MDGSSTAIEADYALTEADLSEGSRVYATRVAGARAMQIILALTVVLGVGHAALSGWALGVWVLAVPAALAGLVFVARSRVGGADKAFRARVAWKREAKIRIDGEGLRFENGGCYSETSHRGLTGWFETARVLVLFDRFGVLGMLPKRAFAAEQLSQVRQILDTAIPRGAAPMPDATARTAGGGRLFWLVMFLVFMGVFLFWRLSQ